MHDVVRPPAQAEVGGHIGPALFACLGDVLLTTLLCYLPNPHHQQDSKFFEVWLYVPGTKPQHDGIQYDNPLTVSPTVR